ncbi:MAG: pantetheine-phosphate adenylyltransferase [Deltaproteobacteria bacterium]|nr:pantetheine-phosphate adenylyltransferase [Deltaproteobacteria bacterium]
MDELAIYPGSFDPLTMGHVDIIHRAVDIFPKLIVAVAVNVRKLPTFTLEERVEMIKDSLAGVERVEIDSFSGLLVDYAKRRKSRVIVRGLRALSDFENEFQMAHMNRRLSPSLETIFMMTSQKHFYVSSQTVKEVAFFNGDVSGIVPAPVLKKLTARGSSGDGSGN